MKISAINNSQKFTGLWGKTKIENSGNEYTSLSFITKTYYPFKDEAVDKIKEIEESNKNSYMSDWYETGGTYVKKMCDVDTKKPLSFTENEYRLYKQSGLGATSPELLKNPIEKELVSKGLFDYLNKGEEYTKELLRRSSLSYKFMNFIKNIGKKVKP